MLSQFAMCNAQLLEMKTAIGMLKTGIAIIYTMHKGLPKGHDNLKSLGPIHFIKIRLSNFLSNEFLVKMYTL